MDIFDIALVAVVIPSLLYVLAAWAMGPERTAEPLHQRLDRHRKLERLWPFYVFMLRLGMLVWVGFLIWSVWSVVRSFLLSGNLDIEFGESEIAQAILFVLAAGYLALSLWRARRPFSSVAAATFRANKAVPVMPGTLPATRHALTDMMLLSTLRDTPTLWYTDADTVDALVVADGVQARIIITDGFTKVLDPLEQRAVFAYLLSTAARTSDRAGISSQSQADLYALEMLRDPRPLIRALLKTADHVAFETAASPELQTEIATAIENLHTSQDVLDVVRRLSDLAASKAAASSRRMLGLPWQELPLPPGIAVTGWGPPSACLFRARKLAEVSGTEGAFTLAEGHGKRPSWIEAPAMSQLGAAAAAQHRST